MKVVFACPGGITRHFRMWPERSLARELAKLEVEVHAFTSKYVLVFGEEPRDVIDGTYVERYWGKRSHPFDLILFLLRMMTLKYSLIHIHFPSYLNELGDTTYLAAKLRNIPYVLTVHGILHNPYIVDNVDEPDFDSIHTDKAIWRFSDMIRRWGLFKDGVRANYFSHAQIRDAERVIALSNFERQILTSKLKVPGSKVVVIPNGIDSDFYSRIPPKKKAKNRVGLKEHNKILLFLGALVKRKGSVYLVKALPHILRRHPDTYAIFAGYMTESREEINKTAKQLGVQDKVLIKEDVSEEEKCDLLASADIFVFPTLYEGFGIPTIEAMACNKPVVSTRIPVIDEIVDDKKTGILVPPRDEIEIAEAVDYLLSNPDIAERMGQAGRSKVEQSFDWKVIAKRTLEVYQSILSIEGWKPDKPQFTKTY